MTGFDLRRALRLYAITDRAWLNGRELVPARDFWGEPLFRLQGHALPE